MIIIFLGLGVAIMGSLHILYNRKNIKQKPRAIWLICLFLFVFGMIGYINFSFVDRRLNFMFYEFGVPLIYWIFDRFFKYLSYKVHARDFILFLNHSQEIDSTIGGKNPHVKLSDKLFSFGLLLIIIGATLSGIILLNP